MALDPDTGAQKWRYDPEIATNQRPANRYVCRGVTWWVDDAAPANAVCRSRIFMGTNDVRLIAFDARSGRELWQGRLPVPGVANPMTYLWKGE
ncbi:PQQ-binding-like beta-propeller repeat protein [Bradyrhizobium sp. OK095]|uniref:outer membrane protein assembly factor BamB family protein n=1 Tax=Bradyrhizobium sp. OK095 TaxID=1882760 RepID=UPI0032DEF1E3